jgi:hypothetical protein
VGNWADEETQAHVKSLLRGLKGNGSTFFKITIEEVDEGDYDQAKAEVQS